MAKNTEEAGIEDMLEVEPEVTEAMFSAAYTVLSEHYMGDGCYDLTRPVLAELYEEMDKAHHKSRPPM